MTPILEARSLAAGHGALRVVHDVDLAVRAGEVTALLGPNGAGKTTTVLTLAGALRPLAGSVLWGGVPVREPLHRRSRRGLALVTERRAVLMHLTLGENLRVARVEPERVFALFPELEEHGRRRVGLLSGGQQQMLALGAAIARRPRVLLADELSLGLAPVVVHRLLEAVRHAADDGVGVLLVEQHVHKAMAIADHVVVLRRGRVELAGPAGVVRDRVEEIQSSYLSAASAG